MSLQFVVGAEHAGYLHAALKPLLRRIREAGLRAPADLVVLADWAQMVTTALSLPCAVPEEDDRPMPLLLTLPQVADQLGCSLSKVKQLVKNGEIPTVTLDRVRRVRAADLRDYVDSLGRHPFRDRVQHKNTAEPSTGRAR